MSNDWVIIVNSRRARCFERQIHDRTLAELSDFVNFDAKLPSAADTGLLEPAGRSRNGIAGLGE